MVLRSIVLFGIFVLASVGVRAEWGYGLRRECKDPFVSPLQQGGWDCDEDKGDVTSPPVASERKAQPKAAANEATNDEPQFQKGDGGLKLTFSSELFFATDSATLGNEARAEIGKLVRWLKKNSSKSVRIEGHTDNSGDANYNKDLSQRRAQAVADAVVSDGISSSRLQAVGFGETKPVASNDTKEGRQANRRVEAFIPS